MQLTDIQTPDGIAQTYVALPPAGRGPGVLLFMDALGVRPTLAQLADRIASWGYVVVAPNVFYREGGVDDVSAQHPLMTDEARDEFFKEAFPRIGRLTGDRALADIDAYLQFMRSTPEVADGPLGAIGFCMGVRLAMRAAGAHPGEIAAVAGFHGGGLVTDEPDSPHLSLATARAEFVFGHADQDPSMTPENAAELRRALDEHGLTASAAIYPGAPHGFTMADTSAYQEAGAERAMGEARELFDRVLGSRPVGPVA